MLMMQQRGLVRGLAKHGAQLHCDDAAAWVGQGPGEARWQLHVDDAAACLAWGY